MVKRIMVNAVHSLFAPGDRTVVADPKELARASRVNHGQDTKLTFGDGSIIVLKGVKKIGDIVAAPSKLPPVGGDVSRHR